MYVLEKIFISFLQTFYKLKKETQHKGYLELNGLTKETTL